MIGRLLKYKLFISMIVFGHMSFAQQSPVTNQYFMDPYLINPAYAGKLASPVLSITAKEFWVAFPENNSGIQLLSYHTRITTKKQASLNQKLPQNKTGVGGMIYHDVNGPLRRLGALASYAFHFRINNSYLGLGLSAYVFNTHTDFQAIKVKNLQDPYFQQAIRNYGTADANLGGYFYNDDMFVSLSINNVTNSAVRFNSYEIADLQKFREYNLMAGYKMELSKRTHFEPTLLAQTDEKFRTRFDLNGRITLEEKFWLGLGGSTIGFTNVFIGFQTDLLRFGYSFQLPTSDLINHSVGSHEIFISMHFDGVSEEKTYRWHKRKY